MPGWRGAHLARSLILLALCIPRLAARLETWQPPQNKTEWASRTIYQILVDRFDPGEGSRGRCPELESYCGGVWKGVTAQIPYIRDLGFDAVWFSPISEQTIGPTWQYPDGYHGYWPRNLWAVNPAFGSAADLEEMIDALHAAGMWAMMDVVPNHVGYGGLPGIAVFNRSEYYHDCSPCQIGCGYSNSDDFQIRHCRLSGLPDLDQDHAYVSAQLMEWHRSAYQQWQVDAYRVDAARHVEVGWLRDLVANVTIFTIGEFADSLERIAGRLAAGALDSSLHFPFSEAATAVFTGRVPMAGLTAELQKIKSALQPLGKEALMGTFIENHDSTRFLCQDNDVRHFENAHALLLFAEGIPIVYYGAELGLQGQRDPLWQAKAAGYEQQELYRFMQTLVRARVAYRVWEFPVTPLTISGPGAEHYYAFQRGPVVVLVNNLPRSGVPTSPPSPPRADSPPAASQLQLSGLKPPLQGRWLADVLQADQAAPDRVLVDGAGYLELPVLPDRWPQVYGLPAPGVRLEGMGRFVPATFKHSSMDRATRALIAYWILAGLLALLLFIRLSGGVRQAIMLPAARLAAALTPPDCLLHSQGQG
ncbi:glycoside hydrolase superfamily [Haematococcus lacustris]